MDAEHATPAHRGSCPKALIADLPEARHFLTLLDPAAETFTFQLATDAEAKDKPKPDPQAWISTRPKTRLKELAARNALRAAVWVMVNEGDGEGRRASNVRRVRAVFLDGDGQVGLDDLRDHDPAPNLIVESSRAHYQAYWLTHRLPLEMFEGVQRSIAKRFGDADPIVDVCRVMRVPGFWHQKDPKRPFQVRIVHEGDVLPYEAEEILGAFPPIEKPSTKAKANGADYNGAWPELPDPLGPKTVEHFAKAFPDVFGRSYPSHSEADFAAARTLAKHGIAEQTIAALIRALRHSADDPKGDRPDYVWGTVHNAIGGLTDFDGAVLRLSELQMVEYDRVRKAEAKALGVRVTTLDKNVSAVRDRKSRSSGRAQGIDQGNQAHGFDQPLSRTQVERSRSLSRSNVLKHVADTVETLGAAGVRREAKILYLAITTRLLPPPIIPAHVIVKGPSAGGKNYLLGTVARLFPESAIFKMTGMSDRALAYLDEPLSHRFILLAEAAAIPEDALAWTLIRSLLSEGSITYPTVGKDENGRLVATVRHLEGPTGLVMTTTLPKINAENETRHLTINVSDEWAQTKTVLIEQAALAQGKEVAKVDLKPWHDYQRWLEEQDRRVVVPYAAHIVELMRNAPVRVRRDFPRFLALVMAHALLHQAYRERDPDGRLVASLDDYEAVHRLAGRAFAESAELRHPKAIVELYNAVAELGGRSSKTDEEGGVTIHDLTKYAEPNEWGSANRDVLTRRCREAISRGLLVNLESRRGRLARYQVSGELHSEGLFPRVEDLEELLARPPFDHGSTAPEVEAKVMRSQAKREGSTLRP
jgi:RepB DNA-primase from phage plasmid